METEELYRIYRSCSCRVTTDSRSIEGGELFFALRGENFDGNAYAASSLEKGACRAVVNRDADCSGADESRLIRVDDPYTSLKELAIWHREHVGGAKRLPVIGLTGTNGKTTTKNLIEAVLARKYKVVATKGNFNNDIGVPLSLLSIKPDTEIAVIEMGANHPDDIAKLVRISRPDYGLITNVGKAHLLGFGSFEGVKAAKGELYKWLGNTENSVIFINDDDEDLRAMAGKIACHQFGYGISTHGISILSTSSSNPFLRLKLYDGTIVGTNLVGSYNAANVAAALAVGNYFGVELKDAADAIGNYVPSNNRSQMTRTENNVLIVDAYNANPSSMSAALDNFSAFESEEKIAMLGDMRELGEESVNEHLKIIGKLEKYGMKAILVGEEFRKAKELSKSDFLWFESSESLLKYLISEPVKGNAILIKGSRGIQMEKIISAL